MYQTIDSEEFQRLQFDKFSTVKKISKKGQTKIIQLKDGSLVVVPFEACITEDSKIGFQKENLFVICVNGATKIWPTYEKINLIELGEKCISIKVKQVTEEKEESAISYLSQFHYKETRHFGKIVRLVASIEDGFSNSEKIIGFIELSPAPILNKARQKVFDSPFKDEKVFWSTWDFKTAGQFSKLIVRIDRVVVHPTYRNLGIAQLLLQNSFEFARDYWQIQNYKPLFLEIVSCMLNFMPFAEKAGMDFVGYTEGNLKRLKKDMRYYMKQKNRKLSKNNAAERMQKRYATFANAMISKYKLSKKDFLKLLDNNPKHLMSHYPEFKDFIRLPKPTFIKGLNQNADEYIKKNASNLIREQALTLLERQDFEISFKGIDVSFDLTFQKSSQTEAINNYFGLTEKNISNPILSDFNFTLKSGEIVLVNGPSGSGKSSILNLFKNRLKATKGNVSKSRKIKIATLAKLANKPIVEQFESNAFNPINLLNMSGLSDVPAYLTKFEDLSSGQQFRSMLAKSLDKNPDVILIDDSLNLLDEITAQIVCKNIRKIANKYNISFVIASPYSEHFEAALMPDKKIVKDMGATHLILTGKS